MARMVRKQILLDPETELDLEKAAKRSKVSQGEFIRRALQKALEEETVEAKRDAAWKRFQALANARQAEGPLPGGRTWTRDDLYDRGSGRKAE